MITRAATLGRVTRYHSTFDLEHSYERTASILVSVCRRYYGSHDQRTMRTLTRLLWKENLLKAVIFKGFSMHAAVLYIRIDDQ